MLIFFTFADTPYGTVHMKKNPQEEKVPYCKHCTGTVEMYETVLTRYVSYFINSVVFLLCTGEFTYVFTESFQFKYQ